jgi:ubiquinone/menaquinone biosynthesis C-methylase UbiE
MRMGSKWTSVLVFVACLLALAAVQSVDTFAQLSSRPAEEWIARLDRPERVQELKVAEIIAQLNLKQGDVVADLGAGSGVFSIPLAQAVGPKGKVYAVDIDQGFLDYINKKAQAQNVKNVVTVLGKFTDPNLPAKDVDVAFFHDVLHHIDKRAEYLKSLGPYVKPLGKVVFIDLDPVTGSHKDEPALTVSTDQAKAWMADVGFTPIKKIDMFTDKWFVIYGRN